MQNTKHIVLALTVGAAPLIFAAPAVTQDRAAATAVSDTTPRDAAIAQRRTAMDFNALGDVARGLGPSATEPQQLAEGKPAGIEPAAAGGRREVAQAQVGSDAVLLPSAGTAQAPEAKVFLNRIGDAVRRHPRIRGAVARGAEAEEAIVEARAPLFPQVDASIDGRRSLVEADRSKDPTLPQSTSRSDAVLAVDQLLFDFGATFSRIDAAKHRSAVASIQTAAEANRFALSAAIAHFDVVRTRSLVEIAQRNVDQHQRFYDMVTERIQAGAAAQSDVLRAESRLADARSTLASYAGEQERAEAAYFEVFDEAPPADLELPPFVLNLPASAAAAVERARDRNFTLRAQDRAVDAAQEEYEATKASNLPRVSMEVAGSRYDLPETGAGLFDVTARLRFNYNLYSGGAAGSRERQALQRVSQARFEADTTRVEVDKAVRAAAADVAMRTNRMRSLDLAVRANESNIAAYFDQFAIGRRTLIDLLDMQRDLFGSAAAMINGRVELEEARYALLTLTGELLDGVGAADVAQSLVQP